MLRLHFAGSEGHPFASRLAAIEPATGAVLAGTTSTGASTVDVLHSDGIDAVIFPFDWLDFIHTLRSSSSSSGAARLIVAADGVSAPLLVRTLAYGFDGVVDMNLEPVHAIGQVARIVDGAWRLESDPAVRGLALTRGLLAKELTLSDADDRHIADLVGTGLPDDEIAAVMDWSIQAVRNRIESLLAANQLSYRTQLAVIRAASLKVPDFN